MQHSPVRLSQTIWSAFKAAKPVRRAAAQAFRSQTTPSKALWYNKLRPVQRPWTIERTRFYSDSKADVDRKAEDAKRRIDETLEARAEETAKPESTLKHETDETIVHTIPEASSIVHSTGQDAQSPPPPKPRPEKAREPLPSQIASYNSRLRKQFNSFMDNFQSHLFIASQRLNDLTGYSGIEALKKEIERQETLVQDSRKAVKVAREQYSEAIATRSTTQREVNDLLHRKHAWNPTDLERFTNLYRSDHANEQAEAAAQREVGDAEARYEEASTKLARTILARYHEEQIWSDKIRQMSTWGTWGLMGLNVLLFIVFQIAIEPWRRRRLVKGFEEKVEVALKERDEDMMKDFIRTNPAPAKAPSEQQADQVADSIAKQLVDTVSGATPSSETSPPASRKDIEEAAETVTVQEIVKDEAGTPDVIPVETVEEPVPTASRMYSEAVSGYAYYEEAFRELFSEKRVVVTQKELTTVAIEGFMGGAAIVGLLLVLLRPR